MWVQTKASFAMYQLLYFELPIARKTQASPKRSENNSSNLSSTRIVIREHLVT